MNELALFAGAGGGILGGHLLGWRTVCAVEWEKYPACVLAARQNDGLLPPFPIWDDVQTFDGKPWRGIVDVVSGGFPCQDISAAGRGGELKVSGQECGRTWQGLLARYDPNTHSLRTVQCSLFEDLNQSLQTWPRWGSMRNGECFQQPMLVQIMKENEFGLSEKIPNNLDFFHTPCTTGIDGGSNSRKALKKRMEIWPTPVARDYKDTGSKEALIRQKNARQSPGVALLVGAENGGSLNPMWVEWLMGWSLGWTDLKPLEMDKSLYVQQQHGNS